MEKKTQQQNCNLALFACWLSLIQPSLLTLGQSRNFFLVGRAVCLQGTPFSSVAPQGSGHLQMCCLYLLACFLSVNTFKNKRTKPPTPKTNISTPTYVKPQLWLSSPERTCQPYLSKVICQWCGFGNQATGKTLSKKDVVNCKDFIKEH